MNGCRKKESQKLFGTFLTSPVFFPFVKISVLSEKLFGQKTAVLNMSIFGRFGKNIKNYWLGKFKNEKSRWRLISIFFKLL